MDELTHLWEDVTENPAGAGVVDAAFDRLVFQPESALLQESRSQLKYTRIERIRYVWAEAQVLWENRALYARQRPSRHAPSVSGRRHLPEEYDPWGIVMPDPLSDFQESENELPVPGSDFVEACGECGGRGRVVCYHCEGEGEVVCGSCGGRGRVICGSCNGRGEVQCDACGGYGKTDFYDYGTNKKYYKTCSRCGGGGTVVCGSCGGSGILVCGRCNGHGAVTCPVCEGEGDLVCDTCQGGGALIFDVVNRQEYIRKNAWAAVSDLEELFRRFPDYQLSTDPQAPPFLTFREEGTLPPPALERYFPAEEVERFARSQVITEVLNDSMSGTEHLVRQGLEIFVKEIYYVHFSFLDQDYECLVDPGADSIHFDRHPFHELLNTQLQQLSLLREQKAYPEFHVLSQRILEVAEKEPAFQEQAKACKKERSQVHRQFFLWQLPGVLGGYLLVLLAFLILRGRGWISGQLLLPGVAALACAWFARLLWPKLPCGEERRFRLSGLVLGAGIGALFTLLFALACP